MKRIFKDSLLQAEFEKKGYVIVDFIDKTKIDFLIQLFRESHPNLPNSGFHSDTFLGDLNLKKKLSDAIQETLHDSYESVLTDYNALGGAFLYKIPSSNSQLNAHQDWTIVDEEHFVALNCWIPLCDTNIENGTLFVLPGSHFLNFKSYRAPTIPFFFEGNEDEIQQYLIPIVLKLGQAIILNESLIHYSSPNKSKNIRIAITSGVISANTPMNFYYKEEDFIEIYEVDYDFLLSFGDFNKDIYARPNGKLLKKMKLDYKPLEKKKLKETINLMYRKAGMNFKKTSILNRLKQWF